MLRGVKISLMKSVQSCRRGGGACRNSATWSVSRHASNHLKNKSKNKSQHPDIGNEQAGVTRRMLDFGTWVSIPDILFS